LGEVGILPGLRKRTDPLFEQIKERFSIRIRTLNRKRFKRDVAEFLSVVNQSMVGHWGFVPLSAAELDYAAKGLSWLLVPELAVGTEINGELVGVSLAIPDYNPRIKKIRGRLFPFGFIRLLARKHRIRKVRVVAANVLPAYQLLGVGLVLLGAMLPKGLEWGMQEAEFSWIAESNTHSRRPLEKGGAKRVKTYRVYDLEP